ncbi:MAG: hypothetical protein ACLQU2_03945 [Candidatus Binataceae bacterium]
MENPSKLQFEDRNQTWSAGVNLLEPECLLPVQYNHLMRKRHVVEGEVKLMLAVLKDAIRGYIRDMDGRTAQARRNFLETYQWVHSVNQDGVFAYDNVCEALGLEPSLLRRWLKSLHDTELAPQRACGR